MSSLEKYQTIVIGAGHAGIEAASASARMGIKTLLITQNTNTIGQMSCNPAIGGIGKGHLVKEIDALDGLMAKAIDLAGIQFRILNSSKGPAVRATRAQADKLLYMKVMRNLIDKQENLQIFQDEVVDIIIENNQVKGIKTQIGLTFFGKSIVLTAGTFLAGKMYIGFNSTEGGRMGDPSAKYLAEKLRDYGFKTDRLKTGTPPRIDAKTINFSKLEKQNSDENLPVFSFLGKKEQHPEQTSCYITYTNKQTHKIIMDNLDRSPLYGGVIKSIGPRYCPSIEDKVVRFAERERHQIFLEPEGLNNNEIYPNGISTSLPFDVQVKIVNSMEGLEQARIIKSGYAIEYDYYDPKELKPSLETKQVTGLFFAGQINGTTGYEEAAAQGCLAGLNAAIYVKQEESWYPTRDLAYMGVLVDDLCTLGTKEPYRMFTSRAEYRLYLREDNADSRLTPIGRKLGLVSDYRWQEFNKKIENIEKEKARLKNIWILPESEKAQQVNAIIKENLSKEANGLELLKRPEVSYQKLTKLNVFSPPIEDLDAAEQIEISEKYYGYIKRQFDEVEKVRKYEKTLIPNNFNYREISGLSNEVVAKLEQHQPVSIGQASRISGITPAAISIILINLKKQGLIKIE